MRENHLVGLSKEFAVNIIQLCEQLRQQGKAVAIVNQLLRSGTSIGANIHEGNYAASKMDFINKFQIALKECYETEYWLEIFRDSGIMDNVAYEHMYAYCAKLRKLLTASVRTAKENQTKENLGFSYHNAFEECKSCTVGAIQVAKRHFMQARLALHLIYDPTVCALRVRENSL